MNTLKMNTLKNRVLALVISVFIILCAVPTVFAESDGECYLGIEYRYEDVVISGAEFSIFAVGELSDDGNTVLGGRFADYPVTFNDTTAETLSGAAKVLYDCARRDGIMPDYTVTTDENGKAAAERLPDGVYLIAGGNCTIAGVEYVTVPQIVFLPAAVGEGETSRVVNIIPKCSPKTEEKQPVTLKVLKVWEDDGAEGRPEEITVYLLCDGEVKESVKLTSEMNWRYVWEDLDGASDWSVSEDVPEGYTVSVRTEGITVVITNTAEPAESETETEEIPEDPDKPEDDIPQTGLLWWPVPVLAIVGIILILCSRFFTKGESKR